MRAYFEDNQSPTSEARYLVGYFAVLSLACFFLVSLILSGWIALGQRANISRRDLNAVELIVVGVAALIGIAGVRTFYGLTNRERASWAWSQWVSLIATVFGLTIAMYGVLGVTKPNATAREFDPQILSAGIVAIALSALAYYLATHDTENSPDRLIRIQLAESPGSGAIIGFVAILLLFTMAADRFSGPVSIASVLTGVSSKGIIAIGVTILMISGEFDLSVGSVLGVSSMIFVLMMTEGLQGAGPLSFGAQPVGVAAIIALFCACVMGFINGILLVTTRIPSFIVTLGTLFGFRAIVLVVIAGGRILRYYDYYSQLPQVFVDRWLMIALALLGAAILVYVAYRVLPAYLQRFLDLWKRQHNNGDFGTLTAIASGLWLVALIVILVVIFVWLLLVALMHAERIKTITGLFFVVLCLALLVAGYFADRFRVQTWQAFAEQRLARAAAAGGHGELRTGIWGTLMELLAYGQAAIAGIVLVVAAIIGFLVSLSFLFVKREDSWQVGFFQIANGQWRFDMNTVSRGLIDINIPTEANFRNAIVWWLVLVIIFHIVLTRTRYGNSVFAVGGNIGAARAQGINASRVKVQNFVLVSFLVGLAGIMEVGYLPSIDPLKGNTWELDVIAMTVVGGTLLTGGYGSTIGTMLGAIIFGMLGTGLVLVGMDPRAFQGVVGVTMIVAVVLNNAAKRVRG